MPMNIFEEKYTLANGVSIPKLGLGTWLLSNEETQEATKTAIRMGYRHIDTAQAYANEAGVGDGIRKFDIRREEIFVTTKIRAEHKTYQSAAASIDDSLKSMGLSYLDMVIIHAPQPWTEFRSEHNRCFEENLQVWKALEDAYQEGKVKAIGVSNFLRDDLENILANCSIKPMVNQVLMHISNTPFALMEFCKKHGILMEAYSPIAHGAVLGNKEIAEIAAKYGVSVAALCIRYILQLGAVALPKTANPNHMKDNANVDFVIADEDMSILQAMDKIKDYGKDGHFPVFAKG